MGLSSTRHRLRLPSWTTHPGFGVAALLVIAVALIAHGEPQPSSRPSGKSVVVSGSAQPATDLPPILTITDGVLQRRVGDQTRSVTLPGHASPRSVLTHDGLSIVLAVIGERQRAYAVSASLSVRDLGYADAVIPAVRGGAVLVESAVIDPGTVPPPPSVSAAPSASAATSASASNSASGSPTSTAPVALEPLKDYAVRRYTTVGLPDGPAEVLPPGSRAAVDTSEGLVVWTPTGRLFDAPTELEPLSASAALIRPDGSLRPIGAVHPLAATATDLLVWNVVRRQFGIMPLRYVTSTVTTTVTATATPTGSTDPAATTTAPSPSRTQSKVRGPHPSATTSRSSAVSTSVSPSRSDSASASASPTAPLGSGSTVVAGTRYFDATRGFTVSGPAAFSADGQSFAVYAQVGSRRRLVVAQLNAALSGPIEVLALAPPVTRSTPPSSAVPTATTVGESESATATPSATPTAVPIVDGFPVEAPVQPLWIGDEVVAVGTDGVVVSYRPGNPQAALLDLGTPGPQAVALAP